MHDREQLVRRLTILKNDFIDFLNNCKENNVQLEFRVKDAPNSKWQPMTLQSFDIFNELYRIKP